MCARATQEQVKAMNDSKSGASYWQIQLFRKNYREQLRLRHIQRLFGNSTGDMRCLAVGGSPALHQALHQLRGQWCSAAFTQEECDALSALTGAPAILCTENRFPSDRRENFDRIIIVETFERLEDDSAFISECHRILKTSGILLLVSTHRKQYSALHLLRRLLDIRPAITASHSNGYTGAELFDLLKDGFDVEDTQTFSRFFAEAGHLIVTVVGGVAVRGTPSTDNETQRADFYRRMYQYFAAMYPWVWLLSRLDFLLMPAKGHQLIARAKKRMWRPRKTPILRDGRSIAEATLGGKIGSAQEY